MGSHRPTRAGDVAIVLAVVAAWVGVCIFMWVG